MTFDLLEKDAPNAYKLLASLVTPRPIALTTTIDREGVVNAAPFSFFNVLGSRPPIVGFCPGDREPGIPKDTARNLRTNHEFVVNLVDETIADGMVACAEELPAGVSELEKAGLTTVPSETVRPPRIAESPVHLECKEWGTLEIGRNRLVIGLIQRLHVREGILDETTLRLVPDQFHPIGRMQSPNGYAKTRDRFELG